MQFTLATVIAVLPFLVAAAPQPKVNGRIALSKRSNLLKQDGSVNFEALKAHVGTVASKLERGFSAFERNTGAAHPNFKKSAFRKRSSGGVPLQDDSEELWQGNIKVGSPAKTYSVDFDTGSSDLFLPGPDCTQNCEGHAIYDPSKSSASRDVGKTFQLRYGDGSTVAGEQFTDTVSIAGLTATKQTLGAADTYSTGFSIDNSPPDGLMGMGFKSISDYNANPLFQTLIAQGVTDESVFAFKLATEGSELFIGGTNPDLFTGEFTQVPVTQEGYWQVNMDGASVAGSKVVSATSSIIDTGTTLVIGDSANVKKLYKKIKGSKDATNTVGAGFFTFPCNTDPKVSLTFGGKSFPISLDSFNLGQVSAGSSDCVGGIIADDIGDQFWIVGDVFLRNVYTSFDVANSQVGFAKLA